MRDGRHRRRGKAFEEPELVQAAVNLWLNQMRFESHAQTAGPECEMDEAASARVGVGRQLCHAAVAVPSASRLRAAVERTRWPAPRPGEVL